MIFKNYFFLVLQHLVLVWFFLFCFVFFYHALSDLVARGNSRIFRVFLFSDLAVKLQAKNPQALSFQREPCINKFVL